MEALNGNLIVVSQDGQRIAFMDERQQPSAGQSLWVDGIKQEYPVNHWPVFSLDGRHVAYAADSGGATARQRFVVLDGVAGPRYEAPLLSMQYSPRNSSFVGQPLFGGPEGKHLAYRATRDKRAFVVLDGVEGREYNAIGRLGFSPDGQKLAYGAELDKKWMMIGSAPAGKEAQFDTVGCPEFGRDGRLGFQASRDGKRFVVLDGVEGPPYAWVSAPRFSPDGKHVAYLASRDGAAMIVRSKFGGALFGRMPFYYLGCGQKCVAVVDGAERALAGPPEWWFSINNNGALAYTYSKGMEVGPGSFSKRLGVVLCDVKNRDRIEVAVVDGKELAEVKGRSDFPPIAPVVFSPDGKRTAFRVQRSRLTFNAVVVDGAEQKSYDEVGDPLFSPDGRHVAHIARLAGRTFLVVDGTELQELENLLPAPGPETIQEGGLWPPFTADFRMNFPVRFSGSSVMYAFVHRGKELVRLKIEIVEPGGGV